MRKPTIFIGSSTEGIDIANAVQQNLERIAEPTIWDQGIFKLSLSTMTSLMKAVKTFEFAIFIFSPDDITILRKEKVSTVRDNIIFETGLFAGNLGIEKVFLLKPRNSPDLHLPSDLSGITIGEYDAERNDKNLVAATAPFCRQAIKRINELKEEERNIEISNLDKKMPDAHEDLLIKELHHVGLTVKNKRKSLAFYKGVLGLKEIQREKFPFPGAWLGLPSGQHIHLVVKPEAIYREYKLTEEDVIKPDSHFALRVSREDYQLIYSRVLSKKIPCQPRPWPDDKLLQLYVLDPNSHIVEIIGLTEEQRKLVYI